MYLDNSLSLLFITICLWSNKSHKNRLLKVRNQSEVMAPCIWFRNLEKSVIEGTDVWIFSNVLSKDLFLNLIPFSTFTPHAVRITHKYPQGHCGLLFPELWALWIWWYNISMVVSNLNVFSLFSSCPWRCWEWSKLWRVNET